MAQKLIKIGVPLNSPRDKGFPFLSERMVDMGGVGWRNGSVVAHAMLGQSKATDSPAIPLKICRLDKDAVFG